MNRSTIRLLASLIALAAGCGVNMLGDWLIGVRIELFWGLDTFSFPWFLQVFIWPVVVGIVVGWIFGVGGKWLAFFPPLIVRFIAYYETAYSLGVPEGAQLMPMGWWGFFVILAMESAGIGGILGEILRKRTYGRSSEAEKAQLAQTTAQAKAAQQAQTQQTRQPSDNQNPQP
jgi:hypothetical protein